MIPAIVLGHGDVARAVAFSLAKEQVPVHLVYTQELDYARFSRFPVNTIRLPMKLSDEEGTLAFLETDPRIPSPALLLPATDPGLSLVARNHARLRQRFTPSIADWTVLGQVLDKLALYRVAESIGVPTPKFRSPVEPAETESLVEEMGLPLMLKPAQTHLFFQVFRRKLSIIRNHRELRETLDAVRGHNLEVMACEIIPGPDSALYHYRGYFRQTGEVPMELCTQKLRQYPKGFGVACYSKTCEMIPPIRDYTRRILRAVDFWGIASAEYKYDSRSGRFVLMEINARPVLVDSLLTKVGFNQPYACYQDRILGRSTPKDDFPVGVYWRHNFLELIRLLYFRDLTIRDYLEAIRNRSIPAVPFAEDPKAYLAKIWTYLLEAKRGVRPT